MRFLQSRVVVSFEAARPYWTQRLLAVLKLRAAGCSQKHIVRIMGRYPSQWALALRHEMRNLSIAMRDRSW